MATIHILLISDTGDGAVAAALTGAERDVTAASGVDAGVAAGAASSPEVIVLDLTGEAATMVAASNVLRTVPALAGVPILCVTATDDIEDRIKLLEAGVDDVVARPFDARELDARIEAVALRLLRTRDLRPRDRADVVVGATNMRRTIVVFSPKGGVGTTTVAVNVATWLAAERPGTVMILDMDQQFGQVATHLNLTPRATVAEVLRDEAAMHDAAVLETSLERHGSGLKVLASASNPAAASDLTADAAVAIIDVAAAGHQYVVIDAGSTLDARTEAVIRRATDLCIVVTPEFPALKAVHALGEALLSALPDSIETTYVVNEIFARELLRPRDIEEALGAKIALTIPYDSFAFLKSVNEGIPVVEGSARSIAAGQLRVLGGRLAGITAGTAPAEKKPRGLGGLFGRG